jgi:hypothetical protein
VQQAHDRSRKRDSTSTAALPRHDDDLLFAVNLRPLQRSRFAPPQARRQHQSNQSTVSASDCRMHAIESHQARAFGPSDAPPANVVAKLAKVLD